MSGAFCFAFSISHDSGDHDLLLSALSVVEVPSRLSAGDALRS
jgi:hypothetical protein